MWAPARRRLLARLNRDSPLTVIRAPRGFGKADLVTSWLEEARPGFRAVVRVPAPDGGQDSGRFWQSVANRLRSTGIIVGEQIPFVLPVSDAEAVRDGLARSGAPVLLVFERIDRIEDDRIEDEILDLLDRCHNVDIVATACGRSVFGDPVRMDPAHELILAHDLQYTPEDAAELFASADIALKPGELDFICDRVGSLPALMRTSVAVAKSLPDVPDRREVLAHRLDAAIDRFMQTAALERAVPADCDEFVVPLAAARVITPEVAEILTGVADAADRLAALETEGIVQHHESSVHDAWVFPPPVRRRLMAHRQRIAGDVAEQLTRLAHHAAERDEIVAALSYAVEARAWDLVTDLLERNWVRLVGSHFTLLRETLQEIPDEVAARRPELRAGREMFALFGAHQTLTANTLPGDPEALDALGATPEVLDLLLIGSIRSFMLRLAGEHDRAADATARLTQLTRSALEHRPDDITAQLPILRLQWGITYQLAGRFPESAGELRLAHRGALAQQNGFVARNAAGNSAMNYALLGEIRQAEDWIALEDAHPDPHGLLEPMVKVGGLVARTLVAIERLDTVAARRYLDELGEGSEREELWSLIVYAHCRYALATGQAYTGMAVLQRAIAARASVLRADASITGVLTTLEMELRLALGEGNRVRAAVEAHESRTPLALVTAARAHLLTGSPAAAVALCRGVDWLGYSYPRTQLEALLVEAAARRALGENAAAARVWEHAVEIADRTGLLGTFATLPREVVAGLDAAARVRSTAVTAFLASDTREIYPAAAHHVVLTERERAVLAELAEGLPTVEIARRLFVSTNTVKSQLRSIYRKIDAHSREEALEAAYRTGLID